MFSPVSAFVGLAFHVIQSRLQRMWLPLLLVTGIVGGLPAAAIAEPLVAVRPAELVFSAVEGESCSAAPQNIGIISSSAGAPVSWQITSNAAWLQVNASNGSTPFELNGSVNCSGLAPGIHQATLTVNDQGSTGTPVTVPAKLIVNPASRVSLSTWKDGYRGAFSVSTDDGQTSGFEVLDEVGLAGTFVMNGTYPPESYFGMFAAGMELGSHLVSHYCYDVDRPTWRYEMEANVAGVAVATQSYDDVVSMVWPCGFSTLEAQAIAAEYFLSARGYNINELEDPTPANFMNLKSFNSHEHEPFPPQDLKSIVDAAETEGKWANLVLHDYTNDDGAIEYSSARNVWVAPIGTVVKYILQRDRTLITQYSETGSTICFSFSRLPIALSVLRDFELTIKPEDQVTFRVDVTGLLPYVTSVSVSGNTVPFDVKTEGSSRILYFSSPAASSEQAVEIGLSNEPPPVVQLSAAKLTFAAGVGGSAPAKTIDIANGGDGELNWTATVNGAGPAWLIVSPASGAGPGTLDVNVDLTGLSEGIYKRAISIAASGAVNSPRTVDVTLVVAPAGAANHVFDYADRTELLADGWDFLASPAAGAPRNTEQTTGKTVIYNPAFGVLHIPADVGDLWDDQNDTRNSIFRDLPANWKSVRVLLDFAPTQNYQQAGVVVYGNDDNYVQMTRIFENGQSITFARETGGVGAVLNSVPTTAKTNIFLRLDRNSATGTISGLYSLDGGVTWQTLGTVAQAVSAPRLGLIVGASPGGYPVATFHSVQVVLDDASPPAAVLQLSATSLGFSTIAGTSPAPQTLGVANGGGGTLQWTATVGGSGSWLSVNPAAGTGAGSISVNVDSVGLPAGTYTKTITVTAAGATNSPQTVPVTLVVSPAAGSGTATYLFSYPDRASLLADGWDFLAKTAAGALRNTEQTGHLSYSTSGLGIPAGPGDLWDNLNDTRNSLFRDLPSSWVSVELSLVFAPTANYQQAGIVVYDDDDHYVQVTRNYNTWSGGQSVAFVSESGGSISDSASATSATALRLRLARSGNLIVGSYSVDGGASWVPVGSASRTFAAPRLGIIVGANDSGGTPPVATLQSVEVVDDSPPTTPVLKLSATSLVFSTGVGTSVAPQSIGVTNEGVGALVWTASIGGSGSWLSLTPDAGTGPGTISVNVDVAALSAGTYTKTVTVTASGASGSPKVVPVTLVVTPAGTATYTFNYPNRTSLLADGWDFLAKTASGANRNTEQAGQLTYSTSGLGIPAGPGDLWDNLNNTRNSLFRDLPSDWTSVELSLVFAPTADHQQAGIVIYDNDDSYVQVTRNFNSWSGGQSVAFVSEAGNSIADGASSTSATTMRLKLARSGNLIAGSYSTNGGSTWVQVGSALRTFSVPRLGIIVGANYSGGAPPVAMIESVQVTLEDTPLPPPAGTVYLFDYADRTSLLADGWDFLAKTAGGENRNTEQVDQVAYSASGLGIPAGPGDLWDNLNDTRNSLFRDLPATWTSVELSLVFAPTANYEQAGIVVYDNDDSYVQVTRNFNSWTGAQAVAFVSEAGSSIADSASPTSATALRLRLARSGNLFVGSYSIDDGLTWVPVGSASRMFTAPRLGIIVGAGGSNAAPVATLLEVKITDTP